jgi:hypothetical protein
MHCPYPNNGKVVSSKTGKTQFSYTLCVMLPSYGTLFQDRITHQTNLSSPMTFRCEYDDFNAKYNLF